MKLIKPFKGLRPTPELASRVASHPYDVVSRKEAAEQAVDNPLSFFHINKPEVDLPDAVSPFDDLVYETGSKNLNRFIENGILEQDPEDTFYLYKQIMGEHEQIGLVAVASIDAYEEGLIKKHELTRPQKEDDRVNHMKALGAQVGPVFLTYRADEKIDQIVNEEIANTPEYDFVAVDNTRHIFWKIEDRVVISALEEAFLKVDSLYVADGHHRSAAASRVRDAYSEANPEHKGDENYNWFLVVVFPDRQMQILDYNRVVKDLNGLECATFIDQVGERFELRKLETSECKKPDREHQFSLYIDGQWFMATAKGSFINQSDPVKNLDVSILQEQLLEPILGISDPRRDERLDFIGGIRGVEELERRVDSGEWALAIALYPTSISSLMAIADANEVMPPKSTWFEPKLKSGLIVHLLN